MMIHQTHFPEGFVALMQSDDGMYTVEVHKDNGFIYTANWTRVSATALKKYREQVRWRRKHRWS